MSTVNPSARFENVQVIQSYVMPESNNADTNANMETEGSGFFITPSPNVPLRPSDITGFLLTAATQEGKLEYSDPDGFLSLGQLSDVVLTAPVSGQLLNFDGVNWVNATPTLEYLDDVTLTAPVAGQVLSYDGAEWVNATAPAAGAGGADTQVQYNNVGVLSGNAGFVFDAATTTLSVINAAVTGTFDCVSVTATGAVEGATLTDGTVVVGPAGAVSGVATMTLAGSTSGSTTIQAAAIDATTAPLVLPAADGAASTFLQNDGAGNLSWAAGGAGSGDVVGPATSTDNAMAVFDGVTGKLLKESTIIDTAGALTGVVSLTATGAVEGATISDGTVSMTAGAVSGVATMTLSGSTSGSTTIQAAAIDATTVPLVLPAADGGASTVLQNDGAGVLSWAAAGAGTGDVVGPATSTANALAVFDGATGKLLQDSTIVNAAGALSGITDLTATGNISLGAAASTVTIGSAATNLVGFYGKAPVAQQATIPIPAQIVDAAYNQANLQATINTIIAGHNVLVTFLSNLGIIA